MWLAYIFLVINHIYGADIPPRRSTCPVHPGLPEFVALSETVIPNSEFREILFVGNTTVVFVIVDDTVNGKKVPASGKVYRSENAGSTWELQNVKFVLDGPAVSIKEIFLEKEADYPTLFFLPDTGTDMWTSRDLGKTYSRHEVPADIREIQLSDDNPGHAIGITKHNDVYMVSNHGEKWDKVSNLPTDFSRLAWNSFDDPSGKVPKTRIFFNAHKSGQNGYSIYYTDDLFKTDPKLVEIPSVGSHSVLTWTIIGPNKMLVVTCIEPVNCREREILFSLDYGKTFAKAFFQIGTQLTSIVTQFIIWEHTDDAIWIMIDDCSEAVSGNCNTQTSTRIYHTHDVSKNFTLSLPNHKLWDMTKYHSLDGIYVANQWLTRFDVQIKETISLITFNKGGEWDLITAPELDAKGQTTNCHVKDGCSLHVYGYSDGMDFFYSTPESLGIMTANGNIGQQLTQRFISCGHSLTGLAGDANFYFSQNGGSTWTEIRKGAHVPEIGDHGSVIIAAKSKELTNEVIYTIDGVNWKNCSMGGTKFQVDNIRVDTYYDSRQFILHGVKGNDVVLTHFDFDRAYKQKCGPNDMVTWSPHDEHGNCFMGKKYHYQRRKLGDECYYGQNFDFNKEKSSEPCPCTIFDYECSACFVKDRLTKNCTSVCFTAGMRARPDDICAGSTSSNPIYYDEEVGYQPLFSCEGPLILKGKTSCEEASFMKVTTGGFGPLGLIVVVVVIFVSAFVIIGALYYNWKNNERFHEYVKKLFGIDDGDDIIVNAPEFQGGSVALSGSDTSQDFSITDESSED